MPSAKLLAESRIPNPAMRFAEDDNTVQYQIRAYAAGQITVNDAVLTRSLVIRSDALIRDWPPQRFEELEAAHLLSAVDPAPEILILGTGARQRFPASALLAPLHARGIGVEVMDTAAACRTYNVLAAEGRAVVAALMMI